AVWCVPEVSRQDWLVLDVFLGGALHFEWRLVDAFAEPVDWDAAAEAAMRAIPDVDVLPLGKRRCQLGIVRFGGRPELFEGPSLHPFDLAVEWRRHQPRDALIGHCAHAGPSRRDQRNRCL
ncbi:MAG: hypothetical protein AAGA32_07635, partial [Pseudomonadota bacterium]